MTARELLDAIDYADATPEQIDAGFDKLAAALRAVLDLIDGCKTAEQVSEGTILGGAVKVRMGAYERVEDAISDALRGES